MAMMIDLDLISEIQLSDGKWYPIKPGSFGIDNLYFQENESRGEHRFMSGRMFYDHISYSDEVAKANEVMGFTAIEKGKETTLFGPLTNVQNFRTIHRSKLPADIKERRKRDNWRNPGFTDDGE